MSMVLRDPWLPARHERQGSKAKLFATKLWLCCGFALRGHEQRSSSPPAPARHFCGSPDSCCGPASVGRPRAMRPEVEDALKQGQKEGADKRNVRATPRVLRVLATIRGASSSRPCGVHARELIHSVSTILFAGCGGGGTPRNATEVGIQCPRRGDVAAVA